MTSRRLLLSATLLLGISFSSLAQITFQRTYGGSGCDVAYSVQQTSDGGYVITGETQSFGAGSGDVYLIRTDPHGDTLWTKTFGGSGEDAGYSICLTNDGGFVVAGAKDYFNEPVPGVYLIRTNSVGDTIWTRTFGGSGTDAGYSVQQTSDGGYVVAGQTSLVGPGAADVYLMKTNANGDLIWSRTYGGSGLDGAYAVQETSDGGYIITGWWNSANAFVYVVKTDVNGDTLWTRRFRRVTGDYGSSVQETHDGGYVIAGVSNYSIFLIKTNTTGDTLWTKAFGSARFHCTIQQTSDHGYVIATSNFQDAYLVRTDEVGDTIWTRIFFGCGAYSLQKTNDGGYVIAGESGDDAYMIKTNSTGVVPVPEEASTPTGFALEENYPNPFNPSTTIGFEIPVSVFVSLKVYNVLGQDIAGLVNEVKQAGKHEVTWDASGQASGVYYCRLQADGFAATKKLILVR